jgi:hypothetical protein
MNRYRVDERQGKATMRPSPNYSGPQWATTGHDVSRRRRPP